VDFLWFLEIISFNSSIVNDKSIDIRDQLLDGATSLYIQGKGTENTNNDETVITEESASLFQTVAEYNRKTRENPHDIDVWTIDLSFTIDELKLIISVFSSVKSPNDGLGSIFCVGIL
jgi:hypothetical protein